MVLLYIFLSDKLEKLRTRKILTCQNQTRMTQQHNFQILTQSNPNLFLEEQKQNCAEKKFNIDYDSAERGQPLLLSPGNLWGRTQRLFLTYRTNLGDFSTIGEVENLPGNLILHFQQLI